MIDRNTKSKVSLQEIIQAQYQACCIKNGANPNEHDEAIFTAGFAVCMSLVNEGTLTCDEAVNKLQAEVRDMMETIKGMKAKVEEQNETLTRCQELLK